jgi:hypothetical protein
MEHQLVEWERVLPKDLGLLNSRDMPFESNGECHIQRYRVIITLRYHNLRILIHRVVVVKFLHACGKTDRDDQEVALLRQIGLNSVRISVQSSLEIIAIVNLIVHSTGAQRGFLGAWWFSLYYSMSLSLLILGWLTNNPPQRSMQHWSFLHVF